MKCVVCVVFALGAVAAHAEVFKCVEGGSVIFRDQPCGGDGGKIVVRPASGQGDPRGLGMREKGGGAPVDPGLQRDSDYMTERWRADEKRHQQEREAAFRQRKDEEEAQKQACLRLRDAMEKAKAHLRSTAQADYAYYNDQLRALQDEEPKVCKSYF